MEKKLVKTTIRINKDIYDKLKRIAKISNSSLQSEINMGLYAIIHLREQLEYKIKKTTTTKKAIKAKSNRGRPLKKSRPRKKINLDKKLAELIKKKDDIWVWKTESIIKNEVPVELLNKKIDKEIISKYPEHIKFYRK
jgi:hypothetical protein